MVARLRGSGRVGPGPGARRGGRHHQSISLEPGFGQGFDFDKLRRLESHLLRQALERTHNNQTQAAKLLNLSRDRLRYRLQKHGLL